MGGYGTDRRQTDKRQTTNVIRNGAFKKNGPSHNSSRLQQNKRLLFNRVTYVTANTTEKVTTKAFNNIHVQGIYTNGEKSLINFDMTQHVNNK